MKKPEWITQSLYDELNRDRPSLETRKLMRRKLTDAQFNEQTEHWKVIDQMFTQPLRSLATHWSLEHDWPKISVGLSEQYPELSEKLTATVFVTVLITAINGTFKSRNDHRASYRRKERWHKTTTHLTDFMLKKLKSDSPIELNRWEVSMDKKSRLLIEKLDAIASREINVSYSKATLVRELESFTHLSWAYLDGKRIDKEKSKNLVQELYKLSLSLPGYLEQAKLGFFYNQKQSKASVTFFVRCFSLDLQQILGKQNLPMVGRFASLCFPDGQPITDNKVYSSLKKWTKPEYIER